MTASVSSVLVQHNYMASRSADISVDPTTANATNALNGTGDMSTFTSNIPRTVSSDNDSSSSVSSFALSPVPFSTATTTTTTTTTLKSPGATVLVGGRGNGSVVPLICDDSGKQSPTHVVKIKIDPNCESSQTVISTVCINHSDAEQAKIDGQERQFSCVSINVSFNKNCHNAANDDVDMARKDQFYYSNCRMTSGQYSPSETLDSGTCSDLDVTPSPPPKSLASNEADQSINRHVRTASDSADSSEDTESSISCDSLNNSRNIAELTSKICLNVQMIGNNEAARQPNAPLVSECTYEERKRANICQRSPRHEQDHHYRFYLNERADPEARKSAHEEEEDETFAGFKILEKDAIRSAKGTVRGVKNRVRAGIATFLQTDTSKNFKAKDAGKVVVYTTTMGVVRVTFNRCELVKQILRTHMVKFEERDMYLSADSQTELKDRLKLDVVHVPQLFIDGQHIGDAEAVERLNESGELRSMLKPYKNFNACVTCQVCGGYRQLPCPVCKGSKKSMHRNNFTKEFTALKCMRCNEVGLVRCPHC